MIQQGMGNGIRILTGNAVEQQKFQNLMFTEMVKTFVKKTLFQSLTMAAMDHLVVCHDFFTSKSDLSCYFRHFSIQ
jgi:hypothetical protein